MKKSIILIFLLSTVSRGYGYKKCCSEGQHLSSDRSYCESKSTENSIQSVISTAGYRIQGSQDGQFGFPTNCKEQENLKFSEKFSISASGELQTPRYRKPIKAENYCIDISEDDIYIVTCNQCAEKLCINLCCPFGFTIAELDFYSYDLYGDSNGTELDLAALEESKDICEVSDVDTVPLMFYGNDEVLKWTEGDQYILVAPHQRDENQFYNYMCPVDRVTNEHALWVPVDPHVDRKLKLSSEGILEGVLDHKSEEEVFIDLPKEHFCISFATNENLTSSVEVKYSSCLFEEQPSYCEDVRKVVFNVGFVISIIFALMAIGAHLIEPQLRDSPFGKISMMYLINFVLEFLVILIDRFADPKVDSGACIFIGYLQQYFFLSFFCWIHAMGFFFFYGLKNLQPRSLHGKRFLILLCCYAQGFPLLMCIITAIVDSVRINSTDENLLLEDWYSYPEMGRYTCYLGHTNAKGTASYFRSPEFIYAQVWQLLILLTNLLMFIQTATYIIKTRKEARNTQANQTKENFMILVKLFIYMMCVWVLEIVTSFINTEYGWNNTCVVRFILDLPNVFYGVIIFLVLICSKPPIIKSLGKRMKDFISSTTSISRDRTTTKDTEFTTRNRDSRRQEDDTCSAVTETDTL